MRGVRVEKSKGYPVRSTEVSVSNPVDGLYSVRLGPTERQQMPVRWDRLPTTPASHPLVAAGSPKAVGSVRRRRSRGAAAQRSVR